MAHRRFSPWPAYVDLFGALAVMFVVGAAYTQKDNKELNKELSEEKKRCAELTEQMTAAQKAAQDLLTKAQKFGDVDARFCDRHLKEAEQLKDMVCLDVQLQFALNSDIIRADEDRHRLVGIAQGLKTWIDEPERAWAANNGQVQVAKRDVQIVVEGHTDSTQPKAVSNPRTLFKYNWDLSARRASSVMFELDRNGLDKTRYNLVAWGRADSDRRCSDGKDPKCQEQDRRTTIKVRFDSTRRQ